MPKKFNQNEILAQEHIHNWIINADQSSRSCSKCPAIQISQTEHQRRTEEWDSYYELVKTTEAYKDYQKMVIATNTYDSKKITEIDKRIMGRNRVIKNQYGDDVLDPLDPMPKPRFPDPERFRYEVI